MKKKQVNHFNIVWNIQHLKRQEWQLMMQKRNMRKMLIMIVAFLGIQLSANATTNYMNWYGAYSLDENNEIVGYVRSATYSPTFKKVVGIAMINKPYWNMKDQFRIEIDEKIHLGTVCDLPFV